MVNRNLIHSLEDEEIEKELGELFSTTAREDLDELNLTELYYPQGVGGEQKYELNEIVEGTIVRVDSDHVICQWCHHMGITSVNHQCSLSFLTQCQNISQLAFG